MLTVEEADIKLWKGGYGLRRQPSKPEIYEKKPRARSQARGEFC